MNLCISKFQGFETRINTVVSTLGGLFDEVKTEGAKYGEDVKYLADFTSGCKKFEPWIEKSEANNKPTHLKKSLCGNNLKTFVTVIVICNRIQ